MKHMVDNSSSHALTEEEMTALACELDHHITSNINKNVVCTGFKHFFQKPLKDIPHIPENELNRIKTNVQQWSTAMQRFHTNREIVSKLSKREDIVILKQEKGRGTLLMDRHKYTDKCLALLSTKQFTTLKNDPIKTLESKDQLTLRKIK